jgi:probable rRNA maturation factor
VVGDIVICHSVAEKNAAGHAGTVDAEIALLLVHGTLHLLGYDHAEPEERALMWSTERTHLQSLYGPMPQDPWVLP